MAQLLKLEIASASMGRMMAQKSDGDKARAKMVEMWGLLVRSSPPFFVCVEMRGWEN
jgi:hypothetical protein